MTRLVGQALSPANPALLRQVVAHVLEHFIAALAFHVFFQAAQRQSDYIAMMQFRTEVLLELEPQVVDTIQIFGP